MKLKTVVVVEVEESFDICNPILAYLLTHVNFFSTRGASLKMRVTQDF